MKKLLSILIILLSATVVVAQSHNPCTTCLPEGIAFMTQSQIDSFQINHPNCTKIEGHVLIITNDATNLDGLSVVDSIGDFLGIYGNDHLVDIAGLANLSSLNGSLYIEQNAALESLGGLENLISIGGYLEIRDNSELVNMGGLDNLTSIPSYLYIRDNESLIDLTGLGSLANIGTFCLITDNASLQSLAGLESLNFVDGIRVSNNGSLVSLIGLDNVVGDSITSLSIYENGSLSLCAVKSVCDYLQAPAGTVEIYGNAPGCNSQEEVDSVCTHLSTGDDHNQTAIFIYPNPTSSMITIEASSTGFLSITNIQGALIHHQKMVAPKTTIDIGKWNSGHYFVKVVDGPVVRMGKFVKL